MTKIQNKVAAQAQAAAQMGMTDYAARSLSALIRAAANQKQQRELLALSSKIAGVVDHPEFII